MEKQRSRISLVIILKKNRKSWKLELIIFRETKRSVVGLHAAGLISFAKSLCALKDDGLLCDVR